MGWRRKQCLIPLGQAHKASHKCSPMSFPFLLWVLRNHILKMTKPRGRSLSRRVTTWRRATYLLVKITHFEHWATEIWSCIWVTPCFNWYRNPAPTSHTWIQSMLGISGGRNVLPHSHSKFPSPVTCTHPQFHHRAQSLVLFLTVLLPGLKAGPPLKLSYPVTHLESPQWKLPASCSGTCLVASTHERPWGKKRIYTSHRINNPTSYK